MGKDKVTDSAKASEVWQWRAKDNYRWTELELTHLTLKYHQDAKQSPIHFTVGETEANGDLATK